MGKNKREKIKLNKINISKKLCILIMLCMFVGVILGSVMANTIDNAQYNSLTNYMNTLFYNLNYNNLLKQELLIKSFFRYGAGILLIWLLGFITIGSLITLCLIILRGASLGFTTSFLIIEYGLLGAWYATIIYIPQNLILIPIYIFIAYNSIKLTLKNLKQNNKTKVKALEISLVEYMVVLAVSIALIFFVSLYEAYIAPMVISFILLK